MFPQCGSSCKLPYHLEPNPLHLVLREPLLSTVIQLRGAGTFVRRHFLGVLEGAAIGEIGCDPGGTERVAADFRRDASRRSAPCYAKIARGTISLATC
jgi:hypothetical protein